MQYDNSSLPVGYQLPPHLCKYQRLIQWPATNPDMAFVNEHLMGLLDSLPIFLWQPSMVKDRLDRFLNMTPEQVLAQVIAGMPEPADMAHPVHRLFVKETLFGKYFGPLKVLESLPGSMCCSFSEMMEKAREKDRLIALIETSIEQLRQITVDPVSIALTARVEIEILPSQEDERVLIGCDGLGYTVVNYTAEGLKIAVLASDQLDSVYCADIPLSELQPMQAVLETSGDIA